MSEYPNLHKLLICRSLLDDTAIQSLMAVLDGDKRQTGIIKREHDCITTIIIFIIEGRILYG